MTIGPSRTSTSISDFCADPQRMILRECVNVSADFDMRQSGRRINDVLPWLASHDRAVLARTHVDIEQRTVGNQVHNLHRALLQLRTHWQPTVVSLRMPSAAKVDLAIRRNEHEPRATDHHLKPLVARVVGEWALLDDSGTPEMPSDAHVFPAIRACPIDDDQFATTVLPRNAPIARRGKELNSGHRCFSSNLPQSSQPGAMQANRSRGCVLDHGKAEHMPNACVIARRLK